MNRWWLTLLAGLGVIAACTCCYGFPFNPSAAVTEEAASAGVRRFVIDTGENTGLSDLTIDRGGHFWSAPERQRFILRLNLTQEHAGVDDAPIPLEGIPDGYDTESITWISDGKFYMGTETQKWHRPVDKIFAVSVEGGRAHVTGHIDFPYSVWGVQARSNDGLESVCYVNGHLWAASESTGTLPDGKRFAPLGRYDAASKTWTPYQVQLTSRIGKLSAMNCRVETTTHRLEFLAVERHFGVSHLLHFSIDENDPSRLVKPELLMDFGRVIDAVPNYEGVAWAPSGDIYLISDNDMGFVTGPTQGLHLPRDWRP